MAAERPDAIVLDLMLPDMDGHDVYERLRGDRSLPPIPIVFLSAQGPRRGDWRATARPR